MQNTLVNVFLKLLDIQSPTHISCFPESRKSVSSNLTSFPMPWGWRGRSISKRNAPQLSPKILPSPRHPLSKFQCPHFLIFLEDVRGIFVNNSQDLLYFLKVLTWFVVSFSHCPAMPPGKQTHVILLAMATTSWILLGGQCDYKAVPMSEVFVWKKCAF